MFNKILLGLLAVAIACALFASGFSFGRYLAKTTGQSTIAAKAAPVS